MLDLRTGKVCKTLIPKISEGIFDVIAEFNKRDDYILYYHSGRKTIRAFRRKDGVQIANYRVQESSNNYHDQLLLRKVKVMVEILSILQFVSWGLGGLVSKTVSRFSFSSLSLNRQS